MNGKNPVITVTSTVLPSALQSGEMRIDRGRCVICAAFDPSADVVQRLSLPSRSDTNRIARPSGENRGCDAKSGPVTIGVARPPVRGMLYSSPTRSNTMVRPSREMSGDIHVPSVVVKSITWRAGGCAARKRGASESAPHSRRSRITDGERGSRRRERPHARTTLQHHRAGVSTILRYSTPV